MAKSAESLAVSYTCRWCHQWIDEGYLMAIAHPLLDYCRGVRAAMRRRGVNPRTGHSGDCPTEQAPFSSRKCFPVISGTDPRFEGIAILNERGLA